MTYSADTYKNKRAVVTGGAGFLGSHLCDQLLSLDNEVVCVDNLVGTHGSTKNIDHLLNNDKFKFINENILDWSGHADLNGVDCIFNQAASKMTVCLKDPALDLEVNAKGTLQLLLSARDQGVRKFIHGSTGSVYGELVSTQDETHPRTPESFYGVSKLAGEAYCRIFAKTYGMDTTVFRYFHIIGPRQDDSDTGGVVPIFIRRMLDKQQITIYGTGEQTRSFTSVFDVVRANVLAALHPGMKNEVFNCASGIQVTIQELADFIIEKMDGNKEIVYADWRPGDILNFEVRNNKIKQFGMKFETNWKKVVSSVIKSMN
ncbi:MAG: UDP-glucose 4-epimerase [Pseudohongiellaceae bacterium]|jgi:UDP-glucose 4-epimerase